MGPWQYVRKMVHPNMKKSMGSEKASQGDGKVQREEREGVLPDGKVNHRGQNTAWQRGGMEQPSAGDPRKCRLFPLLD